MKIVRSIASHQVDLIITNFRMLFVFLVLPVFIVCAILVTVAFQKTQNEVASRLKQSIVVSTDTISRMLNDANTITRSTDNNLVMLIRVLSDKSINYADSQAFKVYQSFLNSFINSSARIDSVYLYVENPGSKVITSSNGLLPMDKLLDSEWEQFLAPSVEDKSVIIREKSDYAFESPKKVMTYVHKFTGYNGVLIINFNLSDIVKVLDSLRYFQDQHIFFKDKKDNFLFGSTGAYERKSEKNIIREEFQLPIEGISSVTEISSDTRLTLIFSHNSIMFMILAVLLSFCIILSYVLSKRSVRELKMVNDLFGQADRNIAPPKINHDKKDPFSTLLQNILKVSIEKDQLQIQLSERKYKQQVAQLQALQYQINPHFLYNTLQIVSYEILKSTKGKRTRANSMIEDLSDLIRYSLGKSGTFVKFEEEIDNCIKYIRIQQTRYQNWFKVVWNIDDSLKNLNLLRLILQPVIENAVVHGLRYKKLDSLLRIIIKRRGDRVFFHIYDNGVGMDRITLEQVRESLSKKDIDYSSPHIGLKNVNARLILEYSPESSIKINSREHICTLVTFSIPFEDAEPINNVESIMTEQ